MFFATGQRVVSIAGMLTLAFLLASLGAPEVLARESNVYFISPKDGSTVTSPFVVRFGLRDWGVAPAGVDKKHTGHHHLLIRRGRGADVPLPPDDEPIGKDDFNRHFGGGQTETTVSLQSGYYALRLVLGDANHYPLESMHSRVIRIRVAE